MIVVFGIIKYSTGDCESSSWGSYHVDQWANIWGDHWFISLVCSPIPLGSTVLIESTLDKEEGKKKFISCKVSSTDGSKLHTEATGTFFCCFFLLNFFLFIFLIPLLLFFLCFVYVFPCSPFCVNQCQPPTERVTQTSQAHL